MRAARPSSVSGAPSGNQALPRPPAGHTTRATPRPSTDAIGTDGRSTPPWMWPSTVRHDPERQRQAAAWLARLTVPRGAYEGVRRRRVGRRAQRPRDAPRGSSRVYQPPLAPADSSAGGAPGRSVLNLELRGFPCPVKSCPVWRAGARNGHYVNNLPNKRTDGRAATRPCTAAARATSTSRTSSRASRSSGRSPRPGSG